LVAVKYDESGEDEERLFAEEVAAYRRSHRTSLPLRRDVASFAERLLGILFPQLSDECDTSAADIRARLTLIGHDLHQLLGGLAEPDEVQRIAREFDAALPDIHRRLCLDAEAIFAGDPAAESVEEVVAAYPGFLAIAMYRIAHELHRHGAPLLPRLLTEVAHTRTGIDIHPGAKIGQSFCIDHGTGIVIGETAVIGNHVKIYQGVTLGAPSVKKSSAGIKRHPTIEDRVVIYANATILGGDTVVGHDSVIGGNVWLPNTVPPFSFVHQTSQVRVRSARHATEPTDFVI
jgi:serine O-acetyltransferase